MVGILRIPYFSAIPWLLSTSTLPTLSLPLYSLATSSIIGAMARHGPHQVAQKSTTTGRSDFSTWLSKSASTKVITSGLAIRLPSAMDEASDYVIKAAG